MHKLLTLFINDYTVKLLKMLQKLRKAINMQNKLYAKSRNLIT